MASMWLLAWTGVGAWSWLLVARGGFWVSGPELPPGEPLRRPVKVTVVVPARNEAEHVEATLRSLLSQGYTGKLRVLLVDDNSSDGTGGRARELGRGEDRLRVLEGAPLEPGWTGKMWTVAQGLGQPEATAADYVLLTDADITHGPGHLQALVSHAERGGFGLVSEMVRLRCESFAERATIPAFVFFFAMLYPFRWVADPGRRTAAAAGGTMLLSRAALDAVGGVSRIRGELIDDVALAREVKRAGYRTWLGHAREAESARRYGSFGDVWEMVARTAYVQLGYSPWMLLGTCAGMTMMYVGPVAATLAGRGRTRMLGAASWCLMAAVFQPTLRRYRRSPLWGFALPAIAVFYVAATVGSAVRFHQGRGGRWKDRVYGG